MTLSAISLGGFLVCFLCGSYSAACEDSGRRPVGLFGFVVGLVGVLILWAT